MLSLRRRAPRFVLSSLYVVDGNSADATFYEFNRNFDGTLASLGTFSAPSNQLLGIAISPDGRHVYMTSLSGNLVHVYARSGDGTLTFVASTAATSPWGILVSPSGRHVYVVSNSNVIYQFIREKDGTLTALTPGTVAVGNQNGLGGVASISRDGKNVYVVNNGDATVTVLTRATDGTLTALGSAVSVGAAPRSVVVSADDTCVYVSSQSSNSVYQFKRSSVDGSLTAFSTPSVACGLGPIGMCVSPDNGSLYVANSPAGSVSCFQINRDGSLTALATRDVNIASGTATPKHVISDPQSTHVYVFAPNTANVYEFSRDAGGNLTLIGTVSATAFWGVIVGQP